MRVPKPKQAVKPYDRPSRSQDAPILTPPRTNSSSSSRQPPARSVIRGDYPQWTLETHANAATVAHPEEVNQFPQLEGFNRTCVVRTPHPVHTSVVYTLATGSALGGNNTCFADYNECRRLLTEKFGNANGSYLYKINASWDQYLVHRDAEENEELASPSPNDLESSTSENKENLIWSGSLLTDYLFFLFSYFVPRTPFGKIDKATRPNRSFGSSVTRDKVIECMLSLCTGVIFGRKTVSSHCQHVCGLLERHLGTQSDEYRSMKFGFENDFPQRENPMGAELELVRRAYPPGSSNAKCPLILPPILAVLLEPAASVDDIDWNRIQCVFDYSETSVPAVILQYWADYAAQQKAAKDAKSSKNTEKSSAQAEGSGKKKRVVRACAARKNGSSAKRSTVRKTSKSTRKTSSADGDGTSSPTAPLRRLRLFVSSGTSSSWSSPDLLTPEPLTEEEEARRAASPVLGMASGHPHNGTSFDHQPRPLSPLTSQAPSTNAVAGPGPSTIALRLSFDMSFARGTK